MNDTALAYLAGIIDGEGNIAIHTREHNNGTIDRSYVNVLKISNNDLRLLKWIRSQTGVGKIYKEVRKRGNRMNHFVWFCPALQAAKILRDVYPYLVIKKDQARLIFLFRKTFDSHRYCRGGVPKSIQVVRAKQFNDLKRLHHREFA